MWESADKGVEIQYLVVACDLVEPTPGLLSFYDALDISFFIEKKTAAAVSDGCNNRSKRGLYRVYISQKGAPHIPESQQGYGNLGGSHKRI